jgi:hypothetical protein
VGGSVDGPDATQGDTIACDEVPAHERPQTDDSIVRLGNDGQGAAERVVEMLPSEELRGAAKKRRLT